MTSRVVFVASPYRASSVTLINRNLEYAYNACRHISQLGHVPYAPHIHDTRFLDDGDPIQRARGLAAGRVMLARCDLAVFFTDYGMSDGMKGDLAAALHHGIPLTTASLELLGDLAVWIDART